MGKFTWYSTGVYIIKSYSRVIAIADEGQSSILQVSDQFGYFSCLIKNDENAEFRQQVLNGNNILVFVSPEWFVVINYM